MIALGLAGLVVVCLLRSTVVSMVTIWYGSNTYSYGFVILPICAFLVWRQRRLLYDLYPTTSFAGVTLFLLCAVIWLAGDVADVQVVQQVAFIGMVEALIWALLGSQTMRVLRFPLLFLFFTIPAGESLVDPLQRITAAFTVDAVRLSGIPAVQDGLLLSTPSGDWKIAEACSGIRYLTSSVVVGVLVAGVLFRTWKRRILFVLISALVPILANALRAYLIVALAYVSNNRIATGVDHIVYGWIFFSLVTAILIGFALRWRQPEVPGLEPVQPVVRTSGPGARNTRLLSYVGILIVIAVTATSAADFLWSRVPPSQPPARMWSGPAGWIATPDLDHDWAPSFEAGESVTFTKDSREVSLYIASYPMKRHGVELVNAGNAVGTTGDWKLLNSDYREAQVADRPVTVAEYWIASGGERRLVWMWYLSGEELTAKPYKIKLMQAESRLGGHPASVVLFAISSKISPQPSEAISQLREFAQGMSFAGLAATPDAPVLPLP
ncbi:MAG: exosortase A [Candidatus Korobacteraceae bacterium]